MDATHGMKLAGRLGVVLAAGLISVWAISCGGGDGGNGNGVTPPPETGNISGAVETTDGTGVSGATVQASKTGATTRNATSGSDGSFGFENLETGTWSLDLTPPEGFEVAPGQSIPASVTVSADQTANVTLNVREKLGAIAGTVQDDAGDPVAGATLTLSFPDGSTATAESGSDGAYSFTDLDEGEYTVAIDPPSGYEVPQGEPEEQTVTVELASTTTVDFTVAPAAGTGSVSGTVQNGTMPIAGAVVTLTSGGGTDRTVETGGDGEFRFRALEPGGFTLTVEPPEGTALGSNEADQKDVTVEADVEAEVSFQLVHVVELTGNNTFSPSSLTVETGSTVRWVNVTTTFHTVTPDGHSEWTRTETQAIETVLEVTFDTAGTFEYFCEPHQAVGMEGEIIVE